MLECPVLRNVPTNERLECPHSFSRHAQTKSSTPAPTPSSIADSKSPNLPRHHIDEGLSGRALTTLPNLRSGSTEPILYLPPLLSRLPVELSPLLSPDVEEEPTKPFSFSDPSISYTHSYLPSIDESSIALHKALHSFHPTSPHYATVPYAEAFNWSSLVLPESLSREWYIVAFRSRRDLASNSASLYEADRAAHEEAVTKGGLLAYWYGSPNEVGDNLATCIWQSRAHAVRANSGKKHVEAMRLAENMFEHFRLERYVLKKVKGKTGLIVEDWQGGEVAF